MLQRFENFKKSLKKISQMKKKNKLFGMNKFSDLSENEFSLLKGGLKLDGFGNGTLSIQEDTRFFSRHSAHHKRHPLRFPNNYDIRETNCTTPVRDQMNCGACWAFSVIAVTEINHCLKTGELYYLSEQELISCTVSELTSPYVSNGCDGGNPYVGIDYIEYKSDSMAYDFPYVGDENERHMPECRQDGGRFPVDIRRFTRGSQRKIKEEDLPAYIYKYGAYSAAIANKPLQYLEYSGGIITEEDLETAPDGPLDHAVTVVGYGEEDGIKYWILRNSWGDDWGEYGYFRLEREKELLGFTVYDYTY
ncbi:unnamed protein product [Bursaphelenchus okinawaensis]|uniref:Peptidase C1A papain C-terminal domain-containing protein n=1 Tax=Bursaphelenchus okinawaensis TaxID=465554 RepID=A0A811LS56_9BILA|nr:unnamed protein product [Bursaphelenchus okinawaensis]CAG9127610.1 unnamed protein product [Bursaphelenchus okinawaensis]